MYNVLFYGIVIQYLFEFYFKIILILVSRKIVLLEYIYKCVLCYFNKVYFKDEEEEKRRKREERIRRGWLMSLELYLVRKKIIWCFDVQNSDNDYVLQNILLQWNF